MNKRIYGHTINYWRRLYENEFGRDTSNETDEECIEVIGNELHNRGVCEKYD